MIRLHITSRLPRTLDASLLRKVARLTYKHTGIKAQTEVNVQFASKRVSRRLNTQFAGVHKPTDVLSFAYHEHDPAVTVHVTDIAICTPIARKQAREHGTTLEAEVALLLAHGILHGLGFDHQTPSTKASFAKLQNDIMDMMKLPSREFFHAEF